MPLFTSANPDPVLSTLALCFAIIAFTAFIVSTASSESRIRESIISSISLADSLDILIGTMVEETGRQVDRLNANADTMQRASTEALDTLKELDNTNVQTREAIDKISQQTDTTNESALKIREATTMITSIAEETNLLSLNAPIEAIKMTFSVALCVSSACEVAPSAISPMARSTCPTASLVSAVPVLKVSAASSGHYLL